MFTSTMPRAVASVGALVAFCGSIFGVRSLLLGCSHLRSAGQEISANLGDECRVALNQYALVRVKALNPIDKAFLRSLLVLCSVSVPGRPGRWLVGRRVSRRRPSVEGGPGRHLRLSAIDVTAAFGQVEKRHPEFMDQPATQSQLPGHSHRSCRPQVIAEQQLML